MKRAAVQWGLGRYLYDLEEGWAQAHEGGRFSAKTKDGKWFKWDPPTLPEWAVPKAPVASVEQMARIEALLDELERLTPPAASAARELVTLLLELHGAALVRMTGRAGEELRASWADDPLVAGVLLLHGLHPVDLETRVRQALQTHGGDVEFLGVEGGGH